MARKKTSPVEELFEVASLLPWWAGVGIAVVAYFLLHSFATAEIAVATKPGEFGHSIGQAIVKTIASLAQFILPIILLAGAAASAIAKAKDKATFPRGAGTQSVNGPRPTEPAGPKRVDAWPDQHGADIYPTWKSASADVAQTKKVDATLQRNNNGGDKGAIAEPRPDKPEDRIYREWKSASFDAKPPAKVDAARWSAKLLGALEWKRFEDVCAGLFERLGFATKSAACGADGGIDIHLYWPPSDQPVAIVQCKAWTKKVGVKVIRELRGVMTSERAAKGIFVTTSTYSDDAIAFAKANKIVLMDGGEVLKSILKLPAEKQTSLLQLATAGDYTTPTCASCGIKLVACKPEALRKAVLGLCELSEVQNETRRGRSVRYY